MTDMMGMDDEELPEMSDDEMMDPMEKAMLDRLDQLGQILSGLQHSIEQMAQAFQQANRPKRILRGPDNRVIGIE